MPATIRVIHAHEFMKATTDGKLDFEASLHLLKEVAVATAAYGDCDIVLDTRQATSEMSAGDLWHLAAELSEHYRRTFERPRKLVVLCPTERFDLAGFFALCSQNRGFDVRAFTSFEDAYTWLAVVPS